MPSRGLRGPAEASEVIDLTLTDSDEEDNRRDRKRVRFTVPEGVESVVLDDTDDEAGPQVPPPPPLVPAPAPAGAVKTEEKEAKEEAPACPICFEDLEPTAVARTVPCKHTFCQPCLVQWSKRARDCALCRGLVTGYIHDIRSETEYKEVKLAGPPRPARYDDFSAHARAARAMAVAVLGRAVHRVIRDDRYGGFYDDTDEDDIDFPIDDYAEYQRLQRNSEGDSGPRVRFNEPLDLNRPFGGQRRAPAPAPPRRRQPDQRVRFADGQPQQPQAAAPAAPPPPAWPGYGIEMAMQLGMGLPPPPGAYMPPPPGAWMLPPLPPPALPPLPLAAHVALGYEPPMPPLPHHYAAPDSNNPGGVVRHFGVLRAPGQNQPPALPSWANPYPGAQQPPQQRPYQQPPPPASGADTDSDAFNSGVEAALRAQRAIDRDLLAIFRGVSSEEEESDAAAPPAPPPGARNWQPDARAAAQLSQIRERRPSRRQRRVSFAESGDEAADGAGRDRDVRGGGTGAGRGGAGGPAAGARDIGGSGARPTVGPRGLGTAWLRRAHEWEVERERDRAPGGVEAAPQNQGAGSGRAAAAPEVPAAAPRSRRYTAEEPRARVSFAPPPPPPTSEREHCGEGGSRAMETHIRFAQQGSSRYGRGHVSEDEADSRQRPPQPASGPRSGRQTGWDQQ